jgi:hypothetical protein
MTHTTRRPLALALRLALMATVANNVLVMAIVVADSADPVAMSAWFVAYAALGFALALVTSHQRSHAVRGGHLPIAISLTGSALSVTGTVTNSTLLFASGTGVTLAAVAVLWPRIRRPRDREL